MSWFLDWHRLCETSPFPKKRHRNSVNIWHLHIFSILHHWRSHPFHKYSTHSYLQCPQSRASSLFNVSRMHQCSPMPGEPVQWNRLSTNFCRWIHWCLSEWSIGTIDPNPMSTSDMRHIFFVQVISLLSGFWDTWSDLDISTAPRPTKTSNQNLQIFQIIKRENWEILTKAWKPTFCHIFS